MADIQPFRGLCFKPNHLDAGVLAPPFDVIDEPERQRLMDASPHNIVRLTKVPEGQGEAWYQQAAETKSRWLAAGILARDESPAFYGYRQVFTVDGREHTRVGFVAAVRLQPWGEGIHPHERTRMGDRADRLNLIRAVRANMSPVFGMYHDPERAGDALLETPESPLLEDVVVDGVSQTFWRINDQATIVALQRLLAESDVVIADGHHRYETALAYRAERRAAEGDPATEQPYDYVMMYLTNVASPGLTILPTHRVISGQQEIDQEALLHALHADFEMWPMADEEHLMQRIAEAASGSVAFGLALQDMGTFVLRLRSIQRARDVAPADLPAELATLDVVVLQNLILEPHLGISAEMLSNTDRVSYATDPHQAIAPVSDRQAQMALLLNPTTVDQVWQVARHRMTMPQKSTFFYPKLLTGLVSNPVDQF